MRITRFNKDGPNTDLYRNLGVVSFEVDDPRIFDSSLYIGFKFLGGDCRNPRNYEFDHANLFIENS